MIAQALAKPPPAGSTIPTGVLDHLAARYRPGGLYVIYLRPDGTLAYADPMAAAFFQQFVRPQVESPLTALGETLRLTCANLTPRRWSLFPGVEAAAFPY